MGERSANWPDWRKEPSHVPRAKRTSMWAKAAVWVVLFVLFALAARHFGWL